MRELSMMASGKMELLGLTSGPSEQRVDYDPSVLQRMQAGG